MKSRIFIFIFLAFAVVILSSAYIQQSAEQLYQSGLYKEEVEGELERAIEIYERIIKDFPENESTAAKALYHIGMCYEKLGKQEALKAYQRLIDEYPGQKQEVALAKERLARLTEAMEKVPHKPTFRKIRIPTGLGYGAKLSPDGKKLAFASEGSIWLAPISGKAGTNITGEPVRLNKPMDSLGSHHPISWSRDGQWIAFNLWDEGDKGIAVIPSNGGEPRRIPVETFRGGTLSPFKISLSPDGKILAFASVEGKELADADIKQEKYSIYTIPIKGGDVVRLTEEGETVVPVFSPDGKKIAYRKIWQKDGDFGMEIYIKQLNGGSPFLISSDPRLRPNSPTWSPDGKMIAFLCRFSEEDYKNSKLWIVPLSKRGKPITSPTIIKIPQEVRFSSLIGWTSDNKIGLLIQAPVYKAVYTVPASGGKAFQITPPGSIYDPRWTPDGKKILFADDGNIYSVPSQGGEVSTVYNCLDNKILVTVPGGGPTLSSDEKTIVFSGSDRRKPRSSSMEVAVHIWTIPAQGGKPTQLTKDFYNPRWPCWSPDGKRIAFVNYREKAEKEFISNIYTIPKEGGTHKQITSESDQVYWGSISWSPDGKWIAYLSKDKTIKIKPVKGGEPRTVTKIKELDYYKELTWAPDSQKIAYTSEKHVWVVTVDGGKPVELKTGLDGYFLKISWSPDGNKIAFTAAQGGEIEFWLLEDFLPLVKK